MIRKWKWTIRNNQIINNCLLLLYFSSYGDDKLKPSVGTRIFLVRIYSNYKKIFL